MLSTIVAILLDQVGRRQHHRGRALRDGRQDQDPGPLHPAVLPARFRQHQCEWVDIINGQVPAETGVPRMFTAINKTIEESSTA